VVHDDERVELNGLQVDDERAVSYAGVMLVATLAGRLGIEALAGGWCGYAVIGLVSRTLGAR
jgi:hypothetical protein